MADITSEGTKEETTRLLTLDPERLAHRLSSRSRRVLSSPESPGASVAAVLRTSSEGPQILLLKRTENPKDPWSGNVALPGGRRDPEDQDTFATAVRETLEESGLDLCTCGQHLGPLDDLQAIARGRYTSLVISPHVFQLHTTTELHLQSEEIAAYRWAPIRPMISGELRTHYPYSYQGNLLQLPAYDVDGWIVWGLTFQMLQMLFDEIQGLSS